MFRDFLRGKILDSFSYQAYFCEENVYQLIGHEALVGLPKRVLWISNPARTCPIWEMRAGGAGEPVVWDYHVVLAVWRQGWEIWDLDHIGGMPIPFVKWVNLSFRLLEETYMPLFRVVDASLYLKLFCSDRSHMRDPQGWKASPPSWPPIGGGVHNLPRWLDMSDHAWHGRIATLLELVNVLGESLQEPKQ